VISKENPLVAPYFSRLKNGEYAANNGWIMNYSGNNFAEDEEAFHYLKRNIVIWSDLVKLRYTRNGRLLQRMESYVCSMSRVFDGIRLDNAHSTELWVGEYLMSKAR
jgi:glycogen debranching enzyme